MIVGLIKFVFGLWIVGMILFGIYGLLAVAADNVIRVYRGR